MSKKKFITERFEEAADIRALFSDIEDNPNKSESKRVEHVLKMLNRLGTLQLTRNHWTANARAEAMKTRSELSRLLRDYQWACEIAYTKEGFRAIVRPVSVDRSQWERDAVRVLLDLMHSPNVLSRIRRCDFCNSWLFASTRSTQRFCDEVCKQREYDSKPENRQRKRASMHKLYEDQKERDLKLKERAKLKR